MSRMKSLSLEQSVKLLTFCLIIVFKLRKKQVTSKKMRLFFSACHFLRTIRRFVVKLTAEFQSVPTDLMRDILNEHKIFSVLDLHNTLICGSDFITTVETPSWMLVQTLDKKTSRWICLVSLPIKRIGRNILGSPTLQFNLFKEAECKTLNIFPEAVCPFGIPYASSVTIALTASSDLKEDINIKLKKFFKVPKYLQEGDYIELDSSSALLVKSIKASVRNIGYLVQTEESSLYQVESEHTLKPPVIRKLRNNQLKAKFDSYENIVESLVTLEPLGLSDYSQSFKNTVKPFLTLENTPLIPRPTFLISGPSGSGKRTIVKTVAASLGLHFVETSCLSLLGESTKASELRIRNAIQNALQLSPAVLYLTDIEVYTFVCYLFELL